VSGEELTDDEARALWRANQRAARANRRRVGSALAGSNEALAELQADWAGLTRALREWRSPDAD